MFDRKEDIINKKIKQFKDRDINVEFDDLELYLDNFFFKKFEKSADNLNNFLLEDNLDEIINFLMNEAIINPKV